MAQRGSRRGSADAAGPGMAQRGSHRVVIGKVTLFDQHRGLGEITADDGTVYPFHCTVIADGTRTIVAGTSVEFEVIPGHLGRWEAADIVQRS
jgi:cold shock CspA family protein